MDLEDRLNDYRKKVNRIRQEQEVMKRKTLDEILSWYDPETKQGQENCHNVWQKQQSLEDQVRHRSTEVKARIEVTEDDQLKILDEFFFERFNLHNYFPSSHFSYPVIYCETIEEFVEAQSMDVKLSEKEKNKLLGKLVQEYEQESRRGSYVWGMDISGVGCYLNGWAFGKKHNHPPKDVLKIPELAKNVLKTAVHEKLGHGFLTMFSTLGQEMHTLGGRTILDADLIGLDVYTDPAHRLAYNQHQALLSSSIIQQEGWSVWIESYFCANLINRTTKHPKYTFAMLLNAISALNFKNSEEKEIKRRLIAACTVLIDENSYKPEVLLEQIKIVKGASRIFDDQIMGLLSQPLRYVLGHILMYQVELRAGTQCVPHAALLAGNLKLNVNQTGLADMTVLLDTDPRLNADARLAMISKIKLEKLNDVNEFARRCEEDYSLPVPTFYK
ncbi:MAG: hypothetical protein GX797_02975 [Chloroflexi bacterium]|jgi:hypothetical protein|nr:hypothetical protein [Chloroflexota bacterium]